MGGNSFLHCGAHSDFNSVAATDVLLFGSRLTGHRSNWTFLVLILLCFLFPSYSYSLADNGTVIYKEHCSACHGFNGAGDTMLGKNLKLQPLASPEVQSQSDAELAVIISKGKGRMPAYDRKLSKDQINDVIKYIRALKK